VGISGPGMFVDVDENTWDSGMMVNVKSMFLTGKFAFRHGRPRGRLHYQYFLHVRPAPQRVDALLRFQGSVIALTQAMAGRPMPGRASASIVSFRRCYPDGVPPAGTSEHLRENGACPRSSSGGTGYIAYAVPGLPPMRRVDHRRRPACRWGVQLTALP